MEVSEFKSLLSRNDPRSICEQTLFDDISWYFTSKLEVEFEDGYSIFRKTVAEQIGVSVEDVFLVGSSKYGFSLSPNKDKTFIEFHEDSDLDLLIVSEPLYRAVWSELLIAYQSGYPWILNRHANEVFRKFTALIKNGNYGTTLLRNRVKILDGISKQVFFQTGISRPLKYRIYESRDAALDYHSTGLETIKKRL